ncbi:MULTISPECIES: hypothetical protein [Psychrilyobacter]|uniref:Bacteriocin n=1 Tax=Psychrilyobacter piezotolerans TaxID=2293438 RepID=A0ABX9KDL4_9FUSO|nr:MULTISPECIES: hypothetical protein [Psychrilyobacter]MCS5422476.1 hypothetical protein [Psychrilyobacter sp. S5]NDI79018.1 hypothetical protein [Psychrilyobacter piezotolerans]RDE59101.1 hypothetical protein DV867_13820 [Psychrilyobacter sp. S5]REI39672.1 hypothetical protein DYH56_13820 [Psychrilyobacter piezotolerans]
MKELTQEEMLEVNGGEWSRNDVIGAASAALEAGWRGLAGAVAVHYIHEGYDRVSRDFHAEQRMRNENRRKRRENKDTGSDKHRDRD